MVKMWMLYDVPEEYIDERMLIGEDIAMALNKIGLKGCKFVGMSTNDIHGTPVKVKASVGEDVHKIKFGDLEIDWNGPVAIKPRQEEISLTLNENMYDVLKTSIISAWIEGDKIEVELDGEYIGTYILMKCDHILSKECEFHIDLKRIYNPDRPEEQQRGIKPGQIYGW